MPNREHIKIPLKVIPEPEPNTRTVFTRTNLSPFIRVEGVGAGNTDLVCGKCGQILVIGAGKGFSMENIIFKCPNCGSFNEVP